MGTKASLKQVLLHGIEPCTAAPPLYLQPAIEANQPGSQSFPVMCQQQSRLNYNGIVHTAHTWSAPKMSSSGDWGDCATGLYRTPATQGHLTKSGDILALPNM